MPEQPVPYWDDVDATRIFPNIAIAAFDLDGTLARSKKPMLEPMAQALSTLTTMLPVAIVSGGAMSLVRSQIIDVLSEQADRTRMHLMPTTGTRYYRWNGDDWQQIYEHNLKSEDRAAAMESLQRHAQALGIWPEHSYGPVLEDRGSQITFSALGQQAPVDLKEQWDPTNELKNELARRVQRDVPHLQVRSGGSTSVDVSDKGVDKAYAVHALADALGVDVAHIMYVGDRMDPDGNDYPAAQAGTTAIRVRGPEDTLALCRSYIEWYQHHACRPNGAQ
ncbi:HAD-IIB family hydrolase [Bifidobacterium gallicum]|uniref:phosphomannomutase n=1 Tax=Bifidobacterium gallicum DSM 20093 = LMG 11596 TaxID=561180 RepID=D1NWT6_9BIFI|nr:HAD-IIB family hydrolase [Bifidobacterium gallicum]EFA22145.1 HAD hydrolase, family IIB [Bifidobacterium gallicum DSM 20093 = LMG 11596]KFI57486.1 HAD family hydrolase [Bifidobacterium gallicum DSM 20093 = LMG 11596]